ncbi:polyprenyl synthetase family protein [Cellulomonas sp. PhB143]|uniref:polyprenyl synthetase family protein n=1 Tax=Cellulomonas sp. PhB143 TaxID=2485186 RepID=UPI0013156D88|nr:polyprenyl synthetase family protein [Cellulomonas sp. PhB143]
MSDEASLAGPAAPAEGWPRAARLGDRVAAGLAETEQVLDDYLAGSVRRARALHPSAGELWAALRDQLGGKRVRPRLVLTAYLGLGGDDVGAAAAVAAAQEVLHTAMLAHDDLLDHDEVRRGRPNLAGSYRARLGAGLTPSETEDQVRAAALLGGDLGLAGAVDVVLRSGVEASLQAELVALIVRSIHTSVAGELLDVTGQSAAPVTFDALRLAGLKTATYTCVVPLLSGAALAGAGSAERAALESYGSAAGVAFQLVDDLLGVLGDPAVTGKSVLGDLREGKRTYLLAVAHARAAPAGRAVLEARVGDPALDESGAGEVRAVLEATGAADAVRTRVDALVADAVAAAEGLPPDLAAELAGLAVALTERSA